MSLHIKLLVSGNYNYGHVFSSLFYISQIFTVNRTKFVNILNIKDSRLRKHAPLSNSTSV